MHVFQSITKALSSLSQRSHPCALGPDLLRHTPVGIGRQDELM